MNKLIEELNKKLKKYDLGCQVKKETITLLHCYLFELDDCKKISEHIKDYTGCKKLDVDYKKEDLCKLIEHNTLDSFCKKEKEAFEMAKKLNMLRVK